MKSKNWSWKKGPWETLPNDKIQVAEPVMVSITACEIRDAVIQNLQTAVGYRKTIPESYTTRHRIRGHELVVRTWPITHFTEVMFRSDDPLSS